MSFPVSTAGIWYVRIAIDLDSFENLEVIMDTEPGSKLYIHLLHISQLFQKCFQMDAYISKQLVSKLNLNQQLTLIAAYNTLGSISSCEVNEIAPKVWRVFSFLFQMISNKEKVARINKKFPYTFYPDSAITNILPHLSLCFCLPFSIHTHAHFFFALINSTISCKHHDPFL